MYVLLDKLPTVAECVQAIYQHAPAYGTNKQKDHIHQLVTIRGVKDKLDREMKKVLNKSSKSKRFETSKYD